MPNLIVTCQAGEQVTVAARDGLRITLPPGA